MTIQEQTGKLAEITNRQREQDEVKRKAMCILKVYGFNHLTQKITDGVGFTNSEFLDFLALAKQYGKPVKPSAIDKVKSALLRPDNRVFNDFGQELK